MTLAREYYNNHVGQCLDSNMYLLTLIMVHVIVDPCYCALIRRITSYNFSIALLSLSLEFSDTKPGEPVTFHGMATLFP